MNGRPLLRLACLALALMLTLVNAAPAVAHAEPREAMPRPGAVLSKSPDEIRLTFNEPLRSASTFVVYNRVFENVPGIEPRVVAGSKEQLAAGVPKLAPGVYTVQWNVVGSDGHLSSGSYSFEVSEPSGSLGLLSLVALVVLAAVAIAASLALLSRRKLHRRH